MGMTVFIDPAGVPATGLSRLCRGGCAAIETHVHEIQDAVDAAHREMWSHEDDKRREWGKAVDLDWRRRLGISI